MKISGKQEEKENLQQLKKSMQTGQDVKVSAISFSDQGFPLGPLLGSVLRRVLSVVYLLFAKLCSLLLEDHKSLVRNLLSLIRIKEISILTIKKSQNKVKASSFSHRNTSRKRVTKLRAKHNTTKTKQEWESKKRHTCSMNTGDGLSLFRDHAWQWPWYHNFPMNFISSPSSVYRPV